VVAPQLASRLVRVSDEVRRTVGVILDRRGGVEAVIVGDNNRLYLPDIGRQRAGTTRLRGLRLIRTQLGQAALSRDDLTDLARLRLDVVAVIGVTEEGRLGEVCWAHLSPHARRAAPEPVRAGPIPLADLDVDFLPFIEAIEAEIRQKQSDGLETRSGVPAVLVYVKTKGDWYADERIEELHELARTAGLNLLETIIQQRYKVDPRTAVGQHKLEDIELTCLDLGAEMLVFGQDLTPGQVRIISERTELKVIDRTQLILDIFAQHAKSRGGKLQVELAQLKYTLPRLVAKNTAMSRLTGGIGGRGPGETKLEINRRRARDRIRRLQKEMARLSTVREGQRQRRVQREVPVVAIVGYTNAGKSTLLNTLTNAEVAAREQMFATLDPTSRRLRFPENRELILTDTVGFIHDLPKELTSAFKATLEELEDAHLLIHLVDVSREGFDRRMAAVDTILDQLGLSQKPRILVFNKIDLLDDGLGANLAETYDAIPCCALDPETLRPLVAEIRRSVWTVELRQQADSSPENGEGEQVFA
jgi:GTP-binding protein HflX